MFVAAVRGKTVRGRIQRTGVRTVRKWIGLGWRKWSVHEPRKRRWHPVWSTRFKRTPSNIEEGVHPPPTKMQGAGAAANTVLPMRAAVPRCPSPGRQSPWWLLVRDGPLPIRWPILPPMATITTKRCVATRTTKPSTERLAATPPLSLTRGYGPP